jgi:hypothetical protein
MGQLLILSEKFYKYFFGFKNFLMIGVTSTNKFSVLISKLFSVSRKLKITYGYLCFLGKLKAVKSCKNALKI